MHISERRDLLVFPRCLHFLIKRHVMIYFPREESDN